VVPVTEHDSSHGRGTTPQACRAGVVTPRKLPAAETPRAVEMKECR
jgi:hypothetical protein